MSFIWLNFVFVLYYLMFEHLMHHRVHIFILIYLLMCNPTYWFQLFAVPWCFYFGKFFCYT